VVCCYVMRSECIMRNSRVVKARGGERSHLREALKPGPMLAKAAWETIENAPPRARSGWALSLVVRQAVNRVHPERASVLYIQTRYAVWFLVLGGFLFDAVLTPYGRTAKAGSGLASPAHEPSSGLFCIRRITCVWRVDSLEPGSCEHQRRDTEPASSRVAEGVSARSNSSVKP